MDAERHVRLFRNGRNQALRRPREFELPGNEALLREEGDRVIVEPLNQCGSLLALLASWDLLDEEIPGIKALPPLDDIEL